MEREIRDSRKQFRCCTCFLVLAIILLSFDYLFWIRGLKYTKLTLCQVIRDEYDYNSQCDPDDEDKSHTGKYDHQITYKQHCSGAKYSLWQACIPKNSDLYWRIERTHNCWTNDDCSLQPVFDDYVGRWPFNWCFCVGLIFLIISIIYISQLSFFLIKIFHISPQQLYYTIKDIWCPQNQIILDYKTNCQYLLNGFFREIHGNKHNIIPHDITQLCEKFYIEESNFEESVAIISGDLDQKPVQYIAERSIVCQSSMLKATKPKYWEWMLLIGIICFLINATFFCYFFLAFGSWSVYKFWGYHIATHQKYYWKDYSVTALYFDRNAKWIKKIKYCVHYGSYPNIHEPIIYSKTIANICEFKDFYAITYSKDGEQDEIRWLNIAFREYNTNHSYGISVTPQSYPRVLRNILRVMESIDVDWINQVIIERI